MKLRRYDIMCGLFVAVVFVCLVGLPLAHRGESTCVPGTIMHRLLMPSSVTTWIGPPMVYGLADWAEFGLYLLMFGLGLMCIVGAAATPKFLTPGFRRELLALGALAVTLVVACGAFWYAWRYECFFHGLLLKYAYLVSAMAFTALLGRTAYLVWHRPYRPLAQEA